MREAVRSIPVWYWLVLILAVVFGVLFCSFTIVVFRALLIEAPSLLPERAGLQAQRVPLQPPWHVRAGESPPFEWNSDPPTSGWHDPVPARAAVYREPVPDANLVHSLEHGYVIISYNCGDLSQEECDELVRKLEDLFVRFGGFKLIVVPRPTLESRIALTAWGWIDKFDEYDEGRIVAFINARRDKGPEDTPE
ncbi:MAG: DUF3105 domain-containing protein [Chloroflexi bacterium]|nr:DUF3105 domain-containing protein [Chloroflexota bacterium]